MGAEHDTGPGARTPQGGAPGRRPGGPPEGGRAPGSSGRRYSAAEKLAWIEAFEASRQGLVAFCRSNGLNTKSFCAWRRRLAHEGEAGLERQAPGAAKPGRKRRGKLGVQIREFTPEERRKAVETFQQSGLSQEVFARTWGVCSKTLARWLRRHAQEGPKGLEPRKPGPRTAASPAGKPKGADPVRAAVVETKRNFPDFGLRKIAHFLGRFHALRVSPGTVRKTLREEGLPKAPSPPARPKRGRPQVRRFERSLPGDLWQSDITSFLLARHHVRVYLTVFLDDFSRYVVSWSLQVHQRQDLVIEALYEGIGRFGKPKEVLTDQGRQYFAWRGKSDFQKRLEKEGIRHVVARAHHPQTVGKTERLWETIQRELWGRVQPQDVAEARERLGHFFAHYNHFRPHQGIDGMVPADRFFGAESTVRKTLEDAMARNELAIALGEPVRKPVFLVGQIGDEQVSLHGERGRLVIQTPSGERREWNSDDIGMASKRGNTSDESEVDPNGSNDGGAEDASDAEGPQARSLPHDAPTRAAGAGALGGGERGAASRGTPPVHGDPRVLAGKDQQGAGGNEARGTAASNLPDVPAGTRRDGSRTPEAAESAEGIGGDRPAGGSQDAASADS